MKYKKTIEDLLKSWGYSKREVPPNNEILKSRIVSEFEKVSVSPAAPMKSPYMMWLSFAFSAAAVAVILVNVSGSPENLYRNSGGSGTYRGTDVVMSPQAESDGASPYQEMNSKLSAPVPNGFSMGAPAPDLSRSIAPLPPYNNREVPVSDTREFLKESYYATLRTRQVSEMQNRVEITVRGMGGRVDGSSAGEKNGYVSFAIPKNRLEAFKISIKDMVGARFYEEQTSSENLLEEKQNIEEQEKATQNSLSSLKNERAAIVKNHNQAISAYQNSLNAFQAEMAALNYEYQTATYARKIEIENKLRELQSKINAIQSNISEENKNYSWRISNADSQIKYMNENLKMIEKQDKNLLESVATVNGSISLTKINLWEFLDEYAPGPLLAWVLFLAAGLSYYWYRRTSRISYDY